MEKGITRKRFLEYAKYDKRLLDLEKQIKKHTKESKNRRKDDVYCANAVWYGYYGNTGYKREMCGLVGHSSKTEQLKNSNAYDVVYDYLYNLLPDCKNCNCLCILPEKTY